MPDQNVGVQVRVVRLAWTSRSGEFSLVAQVTTRSEEPSAALSRAKVNRAETAVVNFPRSNDPVKGLYGNTAGATRTAPFWPLESVNGLVTTYGVAGYYAHPYANPAGRRSLLLVCILSNTNRQVGTGCHHYAVLRFIRAGAPAACESVRTCLITLSFRPFSPGWKSPSSPSSKGKVFSGRNP